jgi:hypothetical protein
MVKENALRTTVYLLRNGKCKGFTKGEFEIVSRATPESGPDRANIYAKYIGPPSKGER